MPTPKAFHEVPVPYPTNMISHPSDNGPSKRPWTPGPLINLSMDGVIGWNCKQWIECDNGKESVHCTGYFSHNYPFCFRTPTPYIEGTRIMWNFMKSHRRNS